MASVNDPVTPSPPAPQTTPAVAPTASPTSSPTEVSQTVSQPPEANAITVKFRPGCRVVRGPDWKYADQDKGEGHVGTVVDVWGNNKPEPPDRCVVVLWDSGKKHTYRTGSEGAFDLCVSDYGFNALPGTTIICDHCKAKVLQGIQWKCVVCLNYDLCSTCYSTDKHDTQHEFWRIDNESLRRTRVPRRSDSKKVVLRGIFVNATVCRGQDWTYENEDDGDGSEGKVLTIKDGREHAVAVKWRGKVGHYRLGQSGKVDLKFISSADGGFYYKNHLPVLGKVMSLTCDFNIGERVKCLHPNNVVKYLHRNHGGWHPDMAKYNTFTGTVVEIDADNDVIVRYDDGKKCRYKQEALTKVEKEEVIPVVKNPMRSPIVQEVIGFGIPRSIVEKCVLKRLSGCGCEFESVDSLVKAVYDLKLMEDEPTNVSARAQTNQSPVAQNTQDRQPRERNIGVATRCYFNVGEKVKCRFDNRVVEELQRGHGGWVDNMAKFNSETGTVVALSTDGLVVVKYSDGTKWIYNQEALARVDLEGQGQDPMDSSVVNEALGVDFPRNLADNQKRLAEGLAAAAPADATPKSPTPLEKTLVKENKRLMEQRLCKICMEKDSSITIMPCGHLVSCDVCARRLQECPICRKRITNFLKTYVQ